MITSEIPTSWQDLQNRVAGILKECGFSVEIEKVVETVRGPVELDVYAEENIKGRRYSIVCECKYWKSSRVPQTTIHAFRSVVGDLGANIGYIVSLKGFQAGAFKSSQMTNIQLLTWEAFQDRFFESWYEEHFAPEVARRLNGALTYCEPVIPKWARWLDVMSEDDRQSFLSLKEKYDPFGYLIMQYTSYMRVLVTDKGRRSIPPLPLMHTLRPEFHEEALEKIPHEVLYEQGYSEFLDKSAAFGEFIEAEFSVFKDKYGYDL